MTIDLDLPCAHENFLAAVAINRIGEDDAGNDTGRPMAYQADITVRCSDCGEPFRWVGVPAGMSFRQPMCSADETELRAPLRPASADPDFGLGLPGFAIRMNGVPPS